MSDSHHTVPLECPYCGRVNDAAFSPDDTDAVPTDGCLTICAYCVGIAIFTGEGETLGVRKPTDEEQAEIDADEDVQALVSVAFRVAMAHMDD